MQEDSIDYWPQVSVVVPVYNRSHLLIPCLQKLCRQSYPEGCYEIIVVDDGSTDDSADVAQSIGRGWSGKLRVIQQDNHGPASARNTGIFASQADLIAFIDSDCIPEQDWLQLLVQALMTTHADGIGGPIINELPPSWIAEYLTVTRFFRHRERNGIVDYLLTANVLFARECLISVGGFSTQNGVWCEDADLSFRLKQSGYTLALSTAGKVTHYGTPRSLQGLMKDLYRYGRGNAILSHNWHNHRTPQAEFIRHGAAALLAPFLAMRLIKNAGLLKALSFSPLIITEHLAFCCGLVNGMFSQDARHE
jgi:glycosyltransferase involved in cell wall biosynthesis